MRIFIAEDDPAIARAIVVMLQKNKYAVEVAHTGTDALDAILAGSYDALILDIMLPGQDGVECLRRLRERERKIPVMMLTARSSEYDKVLGLDAGADDYLTKPFGVMELLSRVRALLRRAGCEGENAALSAGALSLDPARRVVTCGGRPVALTFKEFELLHYLLRNRSLVLSREKIMDAVWGVDYPGESRTVDMHIKSLRQKLGPYGECIVTVRGAGYKIGGAV